MQSSLLWPAHVDVDCLSKKVENGPDRFSLIASTTTIITWNSQLRKSPTISWTLPSSTNEKTFHIRVYWKPGNVLTQNLKDKSRHKSNVIYSADSSGGETYFGETRKSLALQYERQNFTTPNRLVTSQNKQPKHTQGISRATRKPFIEKDDRGPANC